MWDLVLCAGGAVQRGQRGSLPWSSQSGSRGRGTGNLAIAPESGQWLMEGREGRAQGLGAELLPCSLNKVCPTSACRAKEALAAQSLLQGETGEKGPGVTGGGEAARWAGPVKVLNPRGSGEPLELGVTSHLLF